MNMTSSILKKQALAVVADHFNRVFERDIERELTVRRNGNQISCFGRPQSFSPHSRIGNCCETLDL